jgi:hypothetical protein
MTGDAEELLRAWQFVPGEEIAVFLVRTARIWRHQLLPEPDWVVSLESGVVLHDWTVKQTIRAVQKLAERLGIPL